MLDLDGAVSTSMVAGVEPAPTSTTASRDVAAHYGDPYREQKALVAGWAFVDRSDRDVLRVGGVDRLSWLHDLTTQHVRDLPVGVGAEALILSPHGHLEHHFLLANQQDDVLLDGEPGTGPALLAYLQSMRFMLRVEPAKADLAVLTVAGLGLADAIPVAAEPWGLTDWDGILVRRRRWPALAVDLLVPPERLADVVARLVDAGAVPAGQWAWDAIRVEAGEPRLGVDTDHRTLPHEVGWLTSAVHLNKGCYRGQETVARVHNLGRPPRRMVRLHLDGSDSELPLTGAPITVADRQVGFVGTAVRHYELGPIALAVVKRSTPDGPVLAGEVPAMIESLPGLTGQEEPAVPRDRLRLRN
jgi:folate-binding protein YgfZ